MGACARARNISRATPCGAPTACARQPALARPAARARAQARVHPETSLHQGRRRRRSPRPPAPPLRRARRPRARLNAGAGRGHGLQEYLQGLRRARGGGRERALLRGLRRRRLPRDRLLPRGRRALRVLLRAPAAGRGGSWFRVSGLLLFGGHSAVHSASCSACHGRGPVSQGGPSASTAARLPGFCRRGGGRGQPGGRARCGLEPGQPPRAFRRGAARGGRGRALLIVVHLGLGHVPVHVLHHLRRARAHEVSPTLTLGLGGSVPCAVALRRAAPRRLACGPGPSRQGARPEHPLRRIRRCQCMCGRARRIQANPVTRREQHDRRRAGLDF
jgi:hypothetical protein